MDAKERTRFQKILRERKLLLQENLMYQRLTEAMRADMPLEEVYKLIITIVTRGLGFDRAGIFLVQPGGTAVNLAMGVGKRGEFERGRLFPVVNVPNKDAFSDVVFRHKRFFLSNNIQRRRVRGKLKDVDSKIRNHAIVPIEITGGRIIGLLAVDNLFKPRSISKTDLAILANFAAQTGLAIESFRMHEKILSLTITDQLTGLYNRRYFDDCLAGELSRARRYRRSCGLLYVDLDHFKLVNDRHGHACGDAVLQQVAGVLQNDIRRIDRVCRIGGEEFGIVLPEISPEPFLQVAERLRDQIRRAVPRVEAMARKGERMTASFGVGYTPDGDASPDQLMLLADQSLYQAKAAGRDCIGGLLTV